MSATEQTITNQKPALTREDLNEAFRQFASKRNLNAEEGGAQLYADNYILREDKRRLTDEVEDLKKRVPPAGAVVLKGDDVAVYTALKALLKEGQKPEDLANALKEHGQLKLEVDGLKKQQLAVEIAEAEGWKVSTLLKLTNGMDLVVEEVDTEVDDEENPGKKKTVKAKHGFLNIRDAAGNVSGKKRLDEELKDFMPSLVKEPDDEGGESEAENSEQGTKFVRQSKGVKTSSTTANVSKDFLNKRYASPFKKD